MNLLILIALLLTFIINNDASWMKKCNHTMLLIFLIGKSAFVKFQLVSRKLARQSLKVVSVATGSGSVALWGKKNKKKYND